MDNVKVFQALAARCPSTAANYIAEVWCRPLVALYEIDAMDLRLRQRADVIEMRVSHKRELQSMYQWICCLAASRPEKSYAETLELVDCVLAGMSRITIDARSFVMDVTGWTDEELAAIHPMSEI